MASTFDAVAFDRGHRSDPWAFLTSNRPGRFVAYRGDEALRTRIEELADKNTEDELTDAERAEYEGYVQANKFIAILQAKAKKLLISD